MSTRTSPRLPSINTVAAPHTTFTSRAETSVTDGRTALFDRLATPEHRRQVAERALEVLLPALVPSQDASGPVGRFTGMLEQTLDWLDSFAGDSYQDRWRASGMDDEPEICQTGQFTNIWRRQRLLTAIDGLVTAGVLRPSYSWLVIGKRRRLHKIWADNHDQTLFAQLRSAATATGVPALSGQSHGEQPGPNLVPHGAVVGRAQLRGRAR